MYLHTPDSAAESDHDSPGSIWSDRQWYVAVTCMDGRMDRYRFMQRRRNLASYGASDPAGRARKATPEPDGDADAAGGGFHVGRLPAAHHTRLHSTPRGEETFVRSATAPCVAGRVSLQSPHPVFACLSLTSFEGDFRSGLVAFSRLLGSSWMDEVPLDACMLIIRR